MICILFSNYFQVRHLFADGVRLYDWRRILSNYYSFYLNISRILSNYCHQVSAAVSLAHSTESKLHKIVPIYFERNYCVNIVEDDPGRLAVRQWVFLPGECTRWENLLFTMLILHCHYHPRSLVPHPAKRESFIHNPHSALSLPPMVTRTSK